MVWTPQSPGSGVWRTKWYIKQNAGDGYKKLFEDAEKAPDKWMTLRFNMWNFGGSNSPFQPATFPNSDRYYLDVDWVKVSQVSTASAAITEVNGTSVSDAWNATPKIFNNINLIGGLVTDPANNVVNRVSTVITRLTDGYKWKSYDDSGGLHGWVPGSQLVGVASDYPNTKPNFATNALMPGYNDITNGDYMLVADTLTTNYNYLFSSDPVKITIARSANVAPQTVSISPASGSSPVGTARILYSSYSDANEVPDLQILYMQIRMPTGKITWAYVNRYTKTMWLANDTGTAWTGGFRIGSSNVISNQYISINCASSALLESFYTSTVRWSFTPKSPMIGTSNIHLYCRDYAQLYSTNDYRGTWTVTSSGSSNLTSNEGKSGEIDESAAIDKSSQIDEDAGIDQGPPVIEESPPISNGSPTIVESDNSGNSS